MKYSRLETVQVLRDEEAETICVCQEGFTGDPDSKGEPFLFGNKKGKDDNAIFAALLKLTDQKCIYLSFFRVFLVWYLNSEQELIYYYFVEQRLMISGDLNWFGENDHYIHVRSVDNKVDSSIVKNYCKDYEDKDDNDGQRWS
jgi:hypothetical protein